MPRGITKNGVFYKPRNYYISEENITKLKKMSVDMEMSTSALLNLFIRLMDGAMHGSMADYIGETLETVLREKEPQKKGKKPK